jgi:high-affinity iron transporter
LAATLSKGGLSNAMSQIAGPYFLYSFGILFREGTEAMLVIVALKAATRGDGRQYHARHIYKGLAAAIVLSILLAVAANHLISDDTSDTLEGLFQLLAAAALFYSSARLRFSHRQTLPSLALALTAMLAVMRNGADTIVFLQALFSGAAAGAERGAIVVGIAATALALVALLVIADSSLRRIPLAIVLKIVTVTLSAMAVIFIGQGVASLQEADWVAATFVDYLPALPAFGIFPTAQTLGAQTILILAAVALFALRYDAARADKRIAIAAHPESVGAGAPAEN